MKRLGLIVLALALSALNLGAGILFFAPQDSPLTTQLNCVSYDPRYRFRRLNSQQIVERPAILDEWIEQDIIQISRISKCVRVYYATGGLEKVPEIALKHSMTVILGADITSDEERNAEEVNNAIALANRFSNVKSLIVGNEVLLHNQIGDRPRVSESILKKWIGFAREQVRVPVSTSEPIASFVYARDLAQQIDFFAINELLYWASVAADEPGSFYSSIIELAKKLNPEKPILLSEVGWPTAGPIHGAATPGLREMRKFTERFTEWAAKKGIDYNFLEAFDQPWKLEHHEGRVGGQWGIFDARGRLKVQLGPLITGWGALSCGIAVLLSGYLIATLKGMSLKTALYLFAWINAFVLALILIASVGFEQYFVFGPKFLFFVAVPALGMALLAWFGIIEVQEVLDCDDMFRVSKPPADDSASPELPFVSIHVPCSREPPDLVIATIASLLRLRYPNFEIIVIDNNTPDPDLYEPVERFCTEHGDKVRFFHREKLSGFKSGALNLALREANQKAQVIAVVDSDYIVESDWLADLAPYFNDRSIAVVQAPQAYRDWQGKFFSTLIRDEYEGFFRIGMNVRNSRNAIIQHGTMLLIRKDVLVDVGGWAEWCITEDTELGLRILMEGYRALYVPKVYGRGRLPASEQAYMRQRFRWVYGAISITRRYFWELCGLRPGLSKAQRRCFVRGWLPWFVDCTVPFFSFLGLLGAALCLKSYLYFPPKELAYPFVLFFAFRLCNSVVTYRVRVEVGLHRAILANIAGAGLTWTIAAATLQGLFGFPLAFYRTDKKPESVQPSGTSGLRRFVACTEVFPGLTMVICALLLVFKYGMGNRDALTWASALLMLSIPILCRWYLSVACAFEQKVSSSV